MRCWQPYCHIPRNLFCTYFQIFSTPNLESHVSERKQMTRGNATPIDLIKYILSHSQPSPYPFLYKDGKFFKRSWLYYNSRYHDGTFYQFYFNRIPKILIKYTNNTAILFYTNTQALLPSKYRLLKKLKGRRWKTDLWDTQ